MTLSETVDMYGLTVTATYVDKQWTYVCPTLLKQNGAPVTGTGYHPIDALNNMAKAASGRPLVVTTLNIKLNPFHYERW